MARRRRVSELRDRKSYQRRAGRKPPRPITLIVCEGETEREYFEGARIQYGLSTAEVMVAENTAGSAPITVVRFAEKKCTERGSYDHVFCVFDRDAHASFDQARARIAELSGRDRNPLPIEEVVSIPCFEVWVLLHFEKTDAPFDRCDHVIARLRLHMPGYVKAASEVGPRLLQRLEFALDAADWLEARAPDNGYNPFTAVHHVLRHFATVAERKSNP